MSFDESPSVRAMLEGFAMIKFGPSVTMVQVCIIFVL